MYIFNCLKDANTLQAYKLMLIPALYQHKVALTKQNVKSERYEKLNFPLFLFHKRKINKY